jgi:hypothetical protein
VSAPGDGGDEADDFAASARRRRKDEEEAFEGDDGTGMGSLGGRQRDIHLPYSRPESSTSHNKLLRHKPSWMSLKSHRHSAHEGGGGRPLSIAGQGIAITVQTEEVCDDEFSWGEEDGRRDPLRDEEEDEEEKPTR